MTGRAWGAAIIVWTALAASSLRAQVVHLGQGVIAGEPTESSIILQARLTSSQTLVDDDLPGAEGIGRFHVATSGDFASPRVGAWIKADPKKDHILRETITGLQPGTTYYYRLECGPEKGKTVTSRPGKFKTLAGAAAARQDRIAVVTGMNYAFFHGLAPNHSAEAGADRHVGYPALDGIVAAGADYFVSTGDSVYYDHPAGAAAAGTEADLRRKWHQQFVQNRFHRLFENMATFWEKDDHDHRFDDSDLTGGRAPSVELGSAIFLEQVPVPTPTYRTHRVSRDLQIWLTEGRDYRSPNAQPDGPDKSMWGANQTQWLKESLQASDATFKVLISPTPMIGPDRANKRDNHVSPTGFRHERDAFFAWLTESGVQDKGFYIVCGDRHWQYHAIDPSGIEEFSTGAICDANSIVGTFPGEAKSTDPQGLIRQPYHPKTAMGGFLLMTAAAGAAGQGPTLTFDFHDAAGKVHYSIRKQRNQP